MPVLTFQIMPDCPISTMIPVEYPIQPCMCSHLPLPLSLSLSLSAQSWDEFFSRATQGAPPGQAYDAPPTLRPGGVTEDPNLIRDHLAVQALIRAYQIRGRDTVIISTLAYFL